MPMHVLVLNCGSSSVKTRLVEAETGAVAFTGSVDRVGSDNGRSTRRARASGGAEEREESAPGDYREAIRWLADRLPGASQPQAVGHRVVHGGEEYVRPTRIDDEVLRDLERCSRLAPLHNPPNLTGIRAARELFPDLPHVACFDTAFHATLPPHAYRYALPEFLYREHAVRRYGFHGLSHRFVAERAAAFCGRDDLRLVSLHLGNGCSAAAVHAGRSVDTSMGMTPLEGLIMGTRSGDLDPAVPLLLQSLLGKTAGEVDALLNHEAGLEALSGRTGDMRDIEAARAAGDGRAALAFDAFCYRVRKYVGAYAAALGGLDALAFTGGIGENSGTVRSAVCEGLEFLRIRLDPARNGDDHTGEREISAPIAPVRVLVIPANEEWIIARDAAAALAP
jgi:acetate kinase